MSKENRVESSMSAAVIRRASRSSLDTVGMRFQEELLSLTFASQTEFANSSSNSQNSTKSFESLDNEEDRNNPSNEEDEGINDSDQKVYIFPYPISQLPNTGVPVPTGDSQLGGENPLATDVVSGSLPADQITGRHDRSLGDSSSRSTTAGRENDLNKTVLTQASKSLTSLDGRENASATGTPLELAELMAGSQQTDLNQDIESNVGNGLMVDSQAALLKREPKKAIGDLSSETDREAIMQDVDPNDNNLSASDRIAPIDDTATSQDSLSYDQDAAPIRNRRLSRQDRMREEKEGEPNPGNLETKPSQDKEVSFTKTSDPNGQNVDSSLGSNQLNGIVSQAPPIGLLETSFSVAGQPASTQSETLVVNAANNNGASSATVTASIAATTDKAVATESSSIQPIAAGSGRGDAFGSSGSVAGRSEGATGSLPLSRFQQNNLVQRVLKGLEQLSNGGEQVKLRLHPPELGTLQMTLKIEANVMSAHLEVENSLAKEALLNNLQNLRDRLSDQGMSIDRFEVEVRTDSQSGTNSSSGESASDRQSRRDQPESRYAIYNENRLVSDTPNDGKQSVSWFRTTGKLDLSV
ncbi:MAG: flagellar hook-length control protein FliK [Pirellula sp.]|jgi:flagellar hook-length control protein FliK